MVSMASNMSLAEKSAQLRSKNIPPKLTIPQSPSNKDLPNAPRDYSITTKGISHYTPEKIGEILHILGEALVGASVIGKKISDQGRIVRCVQEIQQALSMRQDDVEFYLSRVSTPYSGSPTTAVALSPTSTDPSPNSLSRCLQELQRSASVLNEQLKTYRARPTLIFNSSFRKNRLLELVAALQEAWMHLMVQLSLSISRASSEAASSATGNVNKLAVATGAEDWATLSTEDARSYFIQAEKYYLGCGVAKSYDMAFKRYHTAAKLGLKEAATMLGLMFENGYGVVKDLTSAMMWFKNAAAMNDPAALNQLGRLHELGKGCRVDFSAACEYYKKASDLRDLEGTTNYGLMLQSGKGCTIDVQLAFQKFTFAAEKGYARAQNALGNCYYLGQGVPLDHYQAVKWYKTASDQGFACAHNNLGICHEEGHGTAKDIVSAKNYYNLASELGHSNGTNNLAFMFLIEGQFEEALRLFNVAMSLGSVDAIYNIGTIYEAGCSNLSGVILNKDLDAAIRFYTKAANKDCVKAQFRLATLLICEPALQDYETAVKYLLKAACPESVPESPSQVSPLAASPLDTAFQPTSTVSVVPKERIDAMNLIGELLELGQGDPDQVPDPQSAIVWYKRALKHGHARAAFNLGSLFERGVGIERDLSRAAKLYEEAARRGNWEATERLEELKSLDVLPPSS